MEAFYGILIPFLGTSLGAACALVAIRGHGSRRADAGRGAWILGAARGTEKKEDCPLTERSTGDNPPFEVSDNIGLHAACAAGAPEIV